MNIHIIGGGIIGLSSAWFLNKAGFEVTVIDNTSLKDGTSHGNAGMIVPSHFVPMASPGVVSQGIKWMFNAKSPFFIKPRLNLELIKWLWTFYHSCYAEHTIRSAPVLFEFHEWSKQLYGELAKEAKFDFKFEQKGLLMLFQTAKKEAEELEVAEMADEFGIEAKTLDPSQLRELEPNIRIEARGGVYFPGDAHLYPNLFMTDMIQSLIEKGVKFINNESVVGFNQNGQKIRHILCASGRKIPTDNVLLSAGSWSAKIAKKLGIKLLLQDGKGYSMTLKEPTLRPEIPTILSEAKVAVTPMGKDLRIGGTLEISNFSKRINRKRISGILDSMPRFYPDFALQKLAASDTWIGYRPCTPDGLPYIGKIGNFENITIATGHGMMGMSLGPATGKLIAQILSGKKPSIPTKLFQPNRF